MHGEVAISSDTTCMANTTDQRLDRPLVDKVL